MTQEALKLALEALELHGQQYPHMVKGYCLDAITAIKEALAQTQEPFAHWSDCSVHSEPAYPKGECDCGGFSPQRTWVGLKIEEIASCCRESTTTQLSFAQELEAKLKEKNT